MKKIVLIFSIVIVASSCTTSGPSGLFGKKSLHEEYGDKLKNAGLQETALGKQWFDAGERSLSAPLSINLPYSETGYFAAAEPKAAGLIFNARRGEKLSVNLTKKLLSGFAVYLELWRFTAGEKPSFLQAADTTGASLTYEADRDGKYIVRLQPELLKGGEYTLSITVGPALAFPVTPKVKSNIGSFWGAGRDAGARKHEGIDIFAARGTALVAAADGVITQVNENHLGGRVVFLMPDNRDYTLYYAHLEQQLVQPGQRVRTGDTIGLMGNTGNASTTSPHLHFGVYTNNGAVDPLPFVNRTIKLPEKIVASTANAGHWVRNNKATKVAAATDYDLDTVIAVEENCLLKVEAATANRYKVSLPDGQSAFIASANLTPVSSPLRKATIKNALPILDEPDTLAARIITLSPGQSVNVLASYKGYYFIKNSDNIEGWILKKSL